RRSRCLGLEAWPILSSLHGLAQRKSAQVPRTASGLWDRFGQRAGCEALVTEVELARAFADLYGLGLAVAVLGGGGDLVAARRQLDQTDGAVGGELAADLGGAHIDLDA